MADLWSVGMAVYDSPHKGESTRAFFTCMDLLIHHPLVGEVVVVDNDPKRDCPLAPLGPKSGGKVRYVAMPEPQGTSPPRNRVFQEAKLGRVACIDPHVLLYPGFFESLNAFYADHPESQDDLLHGPMMTEAGVVMATHMNDQWRAEMWGTWGRCWVSPRGTLFSTKDLGNNRLGFCIFMPNGEQADTDRLEGVPEGIGWGGHERVLESAGCREYLDRPFPIPGHGMGFFACRKESWLPFHKDARGFGGEEMTTGLRYRLAGKKSWCVPGAKWWHHFDRPVGVPYRLTQWDKVRNYVLEFRRMGLPLDPIVDHFRPGIGGAMTAPEWNQLLEGAEWPQLTNEQANSAYAATPAEAQRRMSEAHGGLTPRKAGRCGSSPILASGERSEMKPAEFQSPNQQKLALLDKLYKETLTRQTDIQADLPVLTRLAASGNPKGGAARVVELGTRWATSTIGWLAGRPMYLLTIDIHKSEQAEALRPLVPAGTVYDHKVYPDGEYTIPECDVLFLDTDPHTAETVWNQLAKYHRKVTRFIVLHDTVSFGESCDGKPGVLHAVRSFLHSFPDWFPAAHYTAQNGLLILSRDPQDRPEDPIDLSPPRGGPPLAVPAPAVNGSGGANPAAQPVRVKPPDFGPGAELQTILTSLGINADKAGCDCKSKAVQMNLWGVKGCRENFRTIVAWMQDGHGRWGWADKLKAATRAVVSGVAFHLNPADPFPGIVELAINRAEEKERAKAVAGVS